MAVAGPSSDTALARPFAGIAVTTPCSPFPGPSTISDAVAPSNSTDVAWPGIGRISPAGGCVTGGDTAAWAGAMVGGGGVSPELEVQAVTQQAVMRITPQ